MSITTMHDPFLCLRRHCPPVPAGESPRLSPDIQRTALRKLAQLHAVTELLQLRMPPGNRLEVLKGNRKGQHSIRINDQSRVCFRWESDGPHEIEIVDYH